MSEVHKEDFPLRALIVSIEALGCAWALERYMAGGTCDGKLYTITILLC